MRVRSIHMVRHAKAEKRAAWDGPDSLRPLTPYGMRQALGIARELEGEPVDAIVSSPYLRCRQTVQSIGSARDLRVEIDPALAKGEGGSKAVDMLCAMDAERVVCCTHNELIMEIANELNERGIEVILPRREPDGSVPAEARRLGVLDLGSTSFHLLVADLSPAGHLTRVGSERMQLRLGAVLATHDHIPEDVCQRAVETARELVAKAHTWGATRVIPVGTAALRAADNGPELARRIGEAVGEEVRVIAGEEEARIMFGAFRRRVVLPHGRSLGVDLGGGSLELAVGDSHDIHFETTLPLGVTRLHREIVQRDPMRKREAREICERVRDGVAPVAGTIREFAPERVVVAGGTARALGQLYNGLHGLGPSINELELGVDALREAAELLVHATHEERLKLRGMRRRRADLLPTGALILVSLAETLGIPAYTVCDWGLREGVLLDAVPAH